MSHWSSSQDVQEKKLYYSVARARRELSSATCWSLCNWLQLEVIDSSCEDVTKKRRRVKTFEDRSPPNKSDQIIRFDRQSECRRLKFFHGFVPKCRLTFWSPSPLSKMYDIPHASCCSYCTALCSVLSSVECWKNRESKANCNRLPFFCCNKIHSIF